MFVFCLSCNEVRCIEWHALAHQSNRLACVPICCGDPHVFRTVLTHTQTRIDYRDIFGQRRRSTNRGCDDREAVPNSIANVRVVWRNRFGRVLPAEEFGLRGVPSASDDLDRRKISILSPHSVLHPTARSRLVPPTTLEMVSLDVYRAHIPEFDFLEKSVDLTLEVHKQRQWQRTNLSKLEA